MVIGGRAFSLWVLDAGLACCAVEFAAASASTAGGEPLLPLAADATVAQVLVVSGTVTDKTAPLVVRLWERMPEPRYVVSFGACATCGGPYWDSYCVTKGIDQLIPVDVYVPGCPPRPEALLDGLLVLQARLDAGP